MEFTARRKTIQRPKLSVRLLVFAAQPGLQQPDLAVRQFEGLLLAAAHTIIYNSQLFEGSCAISGEKSS